MSKGAKRRAANVHSLSRQAPTHEENNALAVSLLTGPPIVVAILGQAIIEIDLDELLRGAFVRKDDKTWNRLNSDQGPLGTFSQKIALGYAFRFYDDATRHNLGVVRNIRNAFAHAKKLITFENEAVVNELNDIRLPAKPYSRHAKDIRSIRSGIRKNARTAFIRLCLCLSIELIRRKSRSRTASIRNYRRKTNRLSSTRPGSLSLAQALANAPPITLGALAQALKESQSENPSPLSQKIIGALSQEIFGDSPDKKGK